MNDGFTHSSIQPGSFVEVRGKPWLVEALVGEEGTLPTITLSCISDDAQGEQLDVLWDAEIGQRVLDEDKWASVGVGHPDSADVLAAHIRAIRWRSATAADRDLFQAPFRAGIRLDAYQLLPLRKALRLPRVNLLIADDVGLGKTIEAGLIARELLLRRRVDFIVIAAPPAMTVQWKDELEAKFGLSFEIIDRDRIGELRRLIDLHLPSSHWAVTSMTPPGISSLKRVTGSCIGTMPVSRRTVATQIVFDPDIGGYSVGSMMIAPATQSGEIGGTIRLT